ncbi:MAG: MFS transporter [archaeon]
MVEDKKRLIEKTKKLSVKEGSAYSVMDGFGFRYVTPFALSVGANNTQIGLLSSLPGLFGTLSQLLTFKFMKRFTRKKIIFWGVFLQSLMWLVLIAAGIPFFLYGIKTSLSPNIIILVYTVLVLFGSFVGPAWTSMMRDLIPVNRGEYFGRRNQVIGIVALVCMFIAGFLLDYFKQTHIYVGFIVMFLVAGIGRFVSALYFTKHYDPKFEVDDKKYFSLIDFVKKMRENNFGRFVLYYSLVSFACAIASPFFIVYMLKDLGFSYTQYMITVVFNSLTTLLLMPLWGKFADKYGNVEVMRLTGFLIPLLPLLWLATPLVHNMAYLVIFIIFLEIYSGLIWSGFNLSASNFVYDAVSKERLAICSSYLNIINGFFALIGAVIGGYLSSHNISLFGFSPLLTLFVVSAVARFAIYFFYSTSVNEVREVKVFEPHRKVDEQVKLIKSKTGKIAWGLLSSVSLDKFFETKASESEHHFLPNSNNFAKNK